jgi:1-deoxy-D-xylulose-5-phosphate reductoisomerase
MNAANEVAVSAFIDKKIGFTDIPAVIGKTMALHRVREAASIGEVLEADRWARVTGGEIIQNSKGNI